MAKLTVSRSDDLLRYEGYFDNVLAGFAEYRPVGDEILFPHTYVYDEFEGQGVASAIVKFALDEIRATGGLRVIPQCPFVGDYIARHREYLPLVE